MIKKLKDTTTRGIQAALMDARRHLGSASGMVFTLIVVTDLADFDSVMEACVTAGREHPSRILVVTDGRAKADRLDAEIHLGEASPGEIVTLRFHGELAQHRDSVLLPLLLPDSPVIVWWPGTSPASLIDDPIGRLGDRRISDAAGAEDARAALEMRATRLSPGDSDLAWTRLTPWRGLLAAALDHFPARVERARVACDPNNASGMLLAAWLESSLGCEVILDDSEGPGITSATLTTPDGDISLSRTDGKMALYSAPGTTGRKVALRRQDINTLITEELRRMDADDVFDRSMRQLCARCGQPQPGGPKKG